MYSMFDVTQNFQPRARQITWSPSEAEHLKGKSGPNAGDVTVASASASDEAFLAASSSSRWRALSRRPCVCTSTWFSPAQHPKRNYTLIRWIMIQNNIPDGIWFENYVFDLETMWTRKKQKDQYQTMLCVFCPPWPCFAFSPFVGIPSPRKPGGCCSLHPCRAIAKDAAHALRRTKLRDWSIAKECIMFFRFFVKIQFSNVWCFVCE